MASRPCKPDADVMRLWQLLLPGTPFPACGSPVDAGTATSESAESRREQADPRRHWPRARRD